MICRIKVTGVVQGVGYRPFAAHLAHELAIEGTVKNIGGSVIITAAGKREAVEEYIHRLTLQKPEGAVILRVEAAEVEENPELPEGALPIEGKQPRGFTIAESAREDLHELPLLPPDLSVCPRCLAEMNMPSDRRYGHAFISCTSCGPRYSIMKALPYDRDTTVMESFSMCIPCKVEYMGAGRRRHAQTISCPECGPGLFYRGWKTEGDSALAGDDAFGAAAGVLKNGGILAVKGIGGFQLVCLPGAEAAVRKLRLMKHRKKKPFALMFEHLGQIRELCEISEQEEALLTAPAGPIVLLQKKREVFGADVCGDSRYLGAFLPNTPLHSLLLSQTGPLLITSCNHPSEPIMIKEEEVFAWKPEGLEGVLYHDREILSPLDDSVAYVLNDAVHLVRRSRGYVPLPVLLQEGEGSGPETGSCVLAMGGDLKAAFGLFAGDRIVLSQYLGDMEQLTVLKTYEKELCRMEALLETKPETAVCDLHPGYGTVRLARRLLEEGSVKRVISIQHHHAHAASVMAEHGLASCIGVVLDGTGYGTDGAIWGSEFLYCHRSCMERRGHLDYVDFCGGDGVSIDGGLSLLCYLIAAGRQEQEIGDTRYPLVRAALKTGMGIIHSSSMGRLFDAVSALLCLRQINTYEGECAAALENAAWKAAEEGRKPYPLHFSPVLWENDNQKDAAAEWISSAVVLIDEIKTAFDTEAASAGELALGFHHGLAGFVEELCRLIREETKETKVALSGGVFANRLLSGLCRERLTAAGFTVYENEQTPCNDGGLALGQAYLAGFLTEDRRKNLCV